MADTNTNPAHPFERAGLGKAPFRYVGYERCVYVAAHGAPVQPGTCCDYCGTGISNVFWVRSADGKRFKVGSSCINRTHQPTDRLAQIAKRKINSIRAKQAKIRKQARIDAAMAKLEDADVLVAMTDAPHPKAWAASKGMTRLDWAAWMMENSGMKGQFEVARYIEGL